MTKIKNNFIRILIIPVSNLFFYKLHITLVNFKLRHICVFNKAYYEIKKKYCFLGMISSGDSNRIHSFKKIEYGFFDIDKCIEEELKMKISSIFKEKGEKFFREFEEKITLNILRKKM